MISTFDLTLLGSLVSAGGLTFLGQRLWPRFGRDRLTGPTTIGATATARRGNAYERSITVTGARWLTVGALTLFVAYFHGAEQGYLFGPWGDVFFHLAFVSACWQSTAVRLRRAAPPTGESIETSTDQTARLRRESFAPVTESAGDS